MTNQTDPTRRTVCARPLSTRVGWPIEVCLRTVGHRGAHIPGTLSAAHADQHDDTIDRHRTDR